MNLLKRCFLNIEDIEIEVCKNVSGIYFVRHHTYWSIAFGKKIQTQYTIVSPTTWKLWSTIAFQQ